MGTSWVLSQEAALGRVSWRVPPSGRLTALDLGFSVALRPLQRQRGRAAGRSTTEPSPRSREAMGFLGLLSTAAAWVCLALTLFVPPLLIVLVLGLLLPRRAPPQRSGGKCSKVAFVHPDLGIGGAERLVVDAAVALQKAGHEVNIFTARHETNHCFEETRNGTLRVHVHGNFLPRRVLGRFYAACAYLRMCWVSVVIVLLSFRIPFHVIIVDQVSICLPILRLARPRAILFYCHYPDYLLTAKSSVLKSLYRAPLDFLEEVTTGLADQIFVNSRFTAGVFAAAFPLLSWFGVCPDVLYPPLDLQGQDEAARKAADALDVLGEGEQLLLSINRFERKKNVGLAIRTLARLPEETRRLTRLVLAGGYDDRLPENVEHAAELEDLATQLGVADRVVQKRSVSLVEKATLLRHAACLLYTPDREHFGIVPVEAMYARVPVVAVNTGGPLESIVDGAACLPKKVHAFEL
ncbi:ALG2 [Symbiodinium sp. KB8]|nr:ALG2 [Symbiodinium sp. KB8]